MQQSVACEYSGRLRHGRFARRLPAVVAIICMTASTACSAETATTTSEIGFSCSVVGNKLLSPSVTTSSVCATFKDRIDGALVKPTKTMKALSNAGAGDWIKLDVRFSQPGTATAIVVLNAGGRKIVHPEIAVDVMDRPLGQSEIEKLATEVVKLVAGLVER